MLMGLPGRWDACSRTIILDGRPAAFACWGDIMAVGLKSNVVFLDAITGSRTSVLCGHRDVINSLAFSLDGTLLVSGSDDKTANLWDIQTGGVIRTFCDDTSIVLVASISPDSTAIALGTSNGAIRLWGVRSGKCHSNGAGHGSAVTAIIFSPIDSRHLIWSSRDGTIRRWDVDAHQIAASYQEVDGVDDLAYALDGTRFVSCGGKGATVRDSGSGAVVVKLDAPDGTSLFRCCFSPDGKLVVCAAGPTICVWDITIPGTPLVRHLVGHSSPVAFIAFSPSLISGSWDRSVKFWQSSSFLVDPMTTDHMTGLHGSTSIASVKLFAGHGTVVTSDSSGQVKTWDLTTGRCKTSFSTPAKGFQDTHLAGDSLIIVWWMNEEKGFHIWDVYKGQLLRKFHSSLSDIEDLRISGDGSKLFGRSIRYIEAVSMQTGENVGRVEFWIGNLSSFFVHGSKVGIGHSRGMGWDFGGPKVSDFGEFSDRPRLDFVDQSTAARRSIKPRWIEDAITKRLVFRLPERYTKSDAEISWDGRYLLLWSRSGEVVIIDFDCVCPR